ncbi:hypothetical protein I4F81_012379 [Pyropia yezoensis]|uniref:Uncharacterized protein n=1 Tax=Pyropia yezoensis TaxID=2788 RepID=A0ACC3CHZ5_PYRYE|nr:hypothetical protein I4F81_012379 [Neopyropia yezoensis]
MTATSAVALPRPHRRASIAFASTGVMWEVDAGRVPPASEASPAATVAAAARRVRVGVAVSPTSEVPPVGAPSVERIVAPATAAGRQTATACPSGVGVSPSAEALAVSALGVGGGHGSGGRCRRPQSRRCSRRRWRRRRCPHPWPSLPKGCFRPLLPLPSVPLGVGWQPPHPTHPLRSPLCSPTPFSGFTPLIPTCQLTPPPLSGPMLFSRPLPLPRGRRGRRKQGRPGARGGGRRLGGATGGTGSAGESRGKHPGGRGIACLTHASHL